MEEEPGDDKGKLPFKCIWCNIQVDLVRYDSRRCVIRCPGCGYEFRHNAQPPGGEVDGLPPFVAEHYGKEGDQ